MIICGTFLRAQQDLWLSMNRCGSGYITNEIVVVINREKVGCVHAHLREKMRGLRKTALEAQLGLDSVVTYQVAGCRFNRVKQPQVSIVWTVSHVLLNHWWQIVRWNGYNLVVW